MREKLCRGYFTFCWTRLVELVKWQYDTQRVNGLVLKVRVGFNLLIGNHATQTRSH